MTPREVLRRYASFQQYDDPVGAMLDDLREAGFVIVPREPTARELLSRRATAPNINAQFETTENGITGVTSAPVKRVEQQDDGSFTVVIDHWPQARATAPEVEAREAAISAVIPYYTDESKGRGTRLIERVTAAIASREAAVRAEERERAARIAADAAHLIDNSPAAIATAIRSTKP